MHVCARARVSTGEIRAKLRAFFLCEIESACAGQLGSGRTRCAADAAADGLGHAGPLVRASQEPRAAAHGEGCGQG